MRGKLLSVGLEIAPAPGRDRIIEVDHAATLASIRTESGANLLALAQASPVLLVFLRHFGCSFCRKAISDVAELKPELARRNVRPVFVHLGTPEIAQAHFDYYGIPEVERIHDPEARIYRLPVFGLGREDPARSLINPKVLYGWFIRGDIFRYGIGRIDTDGHRCPASSSCATARSSAASAIATSPTSRTI